MKAPSWLCLLFLLSIFGCKSIKTTVHKWETENLTIQQLTPNTFVHISYLDTESYGKVPCNGMIVMNKSEAIIFDTPANNEATKELIDWVEEKERSRIKAVIATHFHVDCLGGLDIFHQKDIPSYANNLTITLAKAAGVTSPQNGFDGLLTLKVGQQKVINEFVGEGHTKDNIVCYNPKDKVLFGGCLIKSNGAGKGNLADANINDWSKTVGNVKMKYGKAVKIIPGHGKVGGTELLDYTIQLFE